MMTTERHRLAGAPRLTVEPRTLAGLAVLLAVMFVAVSTARGAPAAAGNPLPSTSLWDLTRRSDLVVLARAGSGDAVRAEEAGKGKRAAARPLEVIGFGRLRRLQLQLAAAAGDTTRTVRPDFREALLFLRREGSRWRILETLPRARAANGCIWVGADRAFYYARNPWPNGPQLVDRFPSAPVRPASARGKVTRSTAETTTSVTQLLRLIRGWEADLARLRQIDEMTSPLLQMRALRAFLAPSTKPPHSPESVALARQAYREVIQQLEALRSGKPPAPAADSAWPAVRGAPSPVVLLAREKLKSPRLADRAAAIQQLWLAADPTVVEPALQALGDSSASVQLLAAIVLADFADASCSRTLLAKYRVVSQDPKNPLRQPLLRALATSEEPQAVAELILGLQELDDPLRDFIGRLLVWTSGYDPDGATASPKKGARGSFTTGSRPGSPAGGAATPSYVSAAAWQRWYEKQYGRALPLKPWDLARLRDWIARGRAASVSFPSSEMKLIPAQTIGEILAACADLSTPNRDRWCDLLLRCWEAGVLTSRQQRGVVETFGRGSVEMRKSYPVGTTALVRASSGWPATLAFPPQLRIVSTSQLHVDGRPVGRRYPMTYAGVYLPRFCPGDFGPGTHRYRVTTDYVVRMGNALPTSVTVATPEAAFEVVFPNQFTGLEVKTDPELDLRVQRALRFIAASDAVNTSAGAKLVGPAPRFGRTPRRYSLPAGGPFEITVGNGWELAEKLPVDLAFDTEYEMLELGIVMPGAPIFIPHDTTATAELNPFLYRTRLSMMDKPGRYRFRVHLTPSRDVALGHLECQAYWDGLILTSPEMAYRVSPVPPGKKP